MSNAPLPPPQENQAYMEVSALEAGMITLPMRRFIAGAAEHDMQPCPSLSFFLRHSQSNANVVFDLGLRKDVKSYSPGTQDFVAKWFKVDTKQEAGESLQKAGFDPQNVQTVVVSHMHFDHIGNHAPFSKAEFVVGGESRELLANGYPGNPASSFLTDSIPGDRARFLYAEDFTASVGPFARAMDFYGDGSLYIIDAPGHVKGHINVLARTSPDGSWIYLAGDSAHDLRLLSGEKEVAVFQDEHGHTHCAHSDVEEARAHIRRVAELAKLEGVHVLIAHDWQWYEDNKGGTAFYPGIIPPKGKAA